MRKVENNIIGTQYAYPCSPEHHDTIRTVFLWKRALTQFTTRISQSNQLKFLKSMNEPINTNWKHPSDIKRNLNQAIKIL